MLIRQSLTPAPIAPHHTCRPPRPQKAVVAATWPSPPRPGSAAARTASAAAVAAEAADAEDGVVGWNWTGSDEFSALDDRRDSPPLPLPRLRHSKRIVLVRHGQSTWNARNRIQGSSNFSVLTETGVEQAQVAAKLVSGTAGTSGPVPCVARDARVSIFGGTCRHLPGCACRVPLTPSVCPP
jgi:hypothetical protein